MKPLRHILILTIFCSTFVLKAQTRDKNHPILTDKFTVSAGAYFPVKTVKLNVNASIGVPDNNISNEIDLGNSFGFDNSQATFSISADWRFSKNWKLGVQYFSIDNSRKAELKEDIEWGDFVFREGSYAKGGFNIDLYRVFFGRTISEGQNHELGIGLGAHILNVGAFIEGAAYVNDVESGNKLAKASVLAPLPNLGFWYYLAPVKKLIFTAKLDWFAITVDDYYGSLWNINPGVNYQILKNLGLGFNYRFFDVTAKVNKSDWDGKFNMSFSGPLISLSTNF